MQDKTIIVEKRCELLEYLYEKLDYLPKKKVKELLSHRSVVINGRVVTQYNYTLKKNQTITIDTANRYDLLEGFHIDILFEDEDFIVINKPCGLLTVSAGDVYEDTVFKVMLEYTKRGNKNNHIHIVHRLDKDTSGVLLLTKKEDLKRMFQDNWNALVGGRFYYAAVNGYLETPRDSVITYLKEDKNHMIYATKDNTAVKTITNYAVIRQNNNYSLLDIEIMTGKKNQIRICMKELGHPIVGDKKYGFTSKDVKRLCLHAYKLCFKHPLSGEDFAFESVLPKEINRLFL